MTQAVELKRRVRNAETKLFEWRRCRCWISPDGHIVIQSEPSDYPRRLLCVTATSKTNEPLRIDLCREFKSIRVKKTAKARCSIEFVSSTAHGAMQHEELMAASSHHCLKWVQQVRDARREALQNRPTAAAGMTPRNSPGLRDVDEMSENGGTEVKVNTSSALSLGQLSIKDEREEASGDSQQELTILLRVEEALRHLEQEKKESLQREESLKQELASVHDALCLQQAEKNHLDKQVTALEIEKDEWKAKAQRLEKELTRTKEQLAIAQEETALVTSEQVRMKHQNKELLAHVRRLDTLVYGRF